MEDTKNLLKKIKEYENNMEQALKNENDCDFYFWKIELKYLKLKISLRKKNKIKNNKQYKKANGHF